MVDSPLPPGQRALPNFPRFGVVAFAKRPLRSRDIRLEISGALERTIVLTATDLAALPRVTLAAYFKCPATWSHRNVEWIGARFK